MYVSYVEPSVLNDDVKETDHKESYRLGMYYYKTGKCKCLCHG